MRIYIDGIVESVCFRSVDQGACHLIIVRTAGVFCADGNHALCAAQVGTNTSHINRNHFFGIFRHTASAVTDFFVNGEDERNLAIQGKVFVFDPFCKG